MKLASFEAVVRALNQGRVRYLVSGGLAVSAHGYLRFTRHVDLAIDPAHANIMGAFVALAELDYHPAAPVEMAQIADPSIRTGWIRDQGMQVLQFRSDDHRETPINILVYEPFAFDEEYSNALIKPLHGSIEVRFVSLPTLIRMEESTSGEQDRVDMENLRMTLEDDAPTESQGGEFDWRLTSFKGSRREQLRRWSELPLERVLMAVDEMQDVSEHLDATRACERSLGVA